MELGPRRMLENFLNVQNALRHCDAVVHIYLMNLDDCRPENLLIAL